VTPLPIAMHEGALIDYRLRLSGVPFGWRTRIESWEPTALSTDGRRVSRTDRFVGPMRRGIIGTSSWPWTGART